MKNQMEMLEFKSITEINFDQMSSKADLKCQKKYFKQLSVKA